MRICFVGHAFHERTRSTRFFQEALAEVGEVTVRFSSPDDDHTADDALVLEYLESDYDLWVFLQTEYVASRLVPLGLRGAIIVPMYDGARERPETFWRQFVNSRFISFSRALHTMLQRLDQQSTFFQYYPQPRDVLSRPVDKDSWSAFFWERRPATAINAARVARQCHALGIGQLHVHSAPDFPSEAVGRSAYRFRQSISGVSVTASTWFDKREDFQAVMEAPQFHFAPRLYEGIGMTTLEAMASGQVVIAPDTPTANEYIGHMASGILYDPERPFELPVLNSDDVSTLSEGARAKVANGHREWLNDRERLISVIKNDGRSWPASDSSAHFALALRRGVRARRMKALRK